MTKFEERSDEMNHNKVKAVVEEIIYNGQRRMKTVTEIADEIATAVIKIEKYERWLRMQ